MADSFTQKQEEEMIDFLKLSAPFPAKDIEWRLQECGKKGDKIWAMCLAYLTNRAIQQRLDDVCGPQNWKNRYKSGPQGGVICGISINCEGEWVEKWDGAENTQIEATKGGLSDSMKRAAVQWGIGRYLYNLDAMFSIVVEKGEHRGKTKDGVYFQWNPPQLPAWALPPDQPQKQPSGPTLKPLPEHIGGLTEREMSDTLLLIDYAATVETIAKHLADVKGKVSPAQSKTLSDAATKRKAAILAAPVQEVFPGATVE